MTELLTASTTATVAANDLIAALTTASRLRVLPRRRGAGDSSTHITLAPGAVTLTTANIDNGSRVTLPADHDGRTVTIPVDTRAALDAVTPYKGRSINIALDGAYPGNGLWLWVTAESHRHYLIRTTEHQDQPALSGAAATLTADDVATVNRVAVTSSTSPALFTLTNIQLSNPDGRLTAAATDRYRLAFASLAGTAVEGTDILLPAKWFTTITKVLRGQPVTVHANYSWVAVTTDTHAYYARVTATDFPRWRSLVPTTAPTTVHTVARKSLLDAVKRASPRRANGDIEQWVTISAVDGHLNLDAKNSAAVVDVTTAGAHAAVKLNPDYLKDGLNALTGRTVRISLYGGSRPVLVTDGGAVNYLLMPTSGE